MSDDAFRAITAEDMTMPPGWSVSAGSCSRWIIRRAPPDRRSAAHEVDIPRDSLLGPLNGGDHVLMDELDTERCLEIATEYATKRVQFKQPIAMFEGVSFKLAEMYAALDAARQVTYRTAKMIEAGVPAQRESAVTKLVVAENVWKIVDHAMQVLTFLIARELLKEVGSRARR